MRNMSFALTTKQVRAQTKTVTRRRGWATLKPGTLIQPVVKGMGLKKGETVKKIGGPIRVVSVRREALKRLTAEEPYGSKEVEREGFAGEMTPRMFVEFFGKTHGCTSGTWITRIEFEYLTPGEGQG